MSHESYILRLLDECREEIRVSDTKASIIFAAVATLLGCSRTCCSTRTRSFAPTAPRHVLWRCSQSARWSARCSCSDSPSFRESDVPSPAGRGTSKSKHSSKLTRRSSPLLSADAETSIDRHAQQLFTLSRIARRKYTHLRQAMWAVLLAILVMGLAVLSPRCRSALTWYLPSEVVHTPFTHSAQQRNLPLIPFGL